MGNFSYPTKVPIGTYKSTSSNGVTSTSNTSGMATLQKDTLKVGSDNPMYQKLISAGIDASTAYSRQGYQLIRPNLVTMASEQRWGGQNVKDFLITKNVVGLPDLTFSKPAVASNASDRLKRKLRNFTGHSNQLTNVAELKDLPRTIRSVAGSATKLVTTVLESKKRGDNLRRFSSDQWLTWSFGVLPTLAAVDDAVKSVQSYLDRKDHTLKEYGIDSLDWLSSTNTVQTGSHHFNVQYNGQFKHTLSVKITAGYRFQLRSSEDYHLGEHLGFSIRNVVPTLYELLPYSWLVDYFTTAGNVINDTFAANPGSSVYITSSQIYRVEGLVTTKPIALFSQSPLVFWHAEPLKLEYFEFKRTPLTQLPRAILRFKTSNEIANNAVTKLLNLTALLGSKR